jgi:iron-sulfur cluster repair protein YtfE (RIC family)
MDVYQILMQDHRTVEQLFVEIEATGASEVEHRDVLFRKLRKAIEDHTVTEETLFYPEIDKYAGTREFIAEAFDDHAEFDQILQEISELPVESAEWLDRINELRQLIEEHVRKEEDKMFPAAQRELDENRAEELGRQIQQMRQKDG